MITKSKNAILAMLSMSMRRVSFRVLMVIAMTLCVSLSSCSKDDDDGNNDNSLLIGKWEAVSDYIQQNNSWVLDYTYKAGECIWTFDETHVLIQDEKDLMNGQKSVYSYNASKKELAVMGMVSPVLKLTETEFELESSYTEVELGSESTVTTTKLKIVFKKIQ
jgi:hypothetical protein